MPQSPPGQARGQLGNPTQRASKKPRPIQSRRGPRPLVPTPVLPRPTRRRGIETAALDALAHPRPDHQTSPADHHPDHQRLAHRPRPRRHPPAHRSPHLNQTSRRSTHRPPRLRRGLNGPQSPPGATADAARPVHNTINHPRTPETEKSIARRPSPDISRRIGAKNRSTSTSRLPTFTPMVDSEAACLEALGCRRVAPKP